MSSEPTPENSNFQSQKLSLQNSNKHLEFKNIADYPYENKEIESICNNFVENLFLINPISYESFGQNNYGIKKITDASNKSDLKLDNIQKKYSLESSPIQTDKQKQEKNIDEENVENKENSDNESDSLKEVNIHKKSDNNISEESIKENRSVSSSNKSNTARENICRNFIDEIFSEEKEKYANKRTQRDELNIVGNTEHTKSKKSNLSNNSNQKENEIYKNKDSFKMTPEKVIMI